MRPTSSALSFISVPRYFKSAARVLHHILWQMDPLSGAVLTRQLPLPLQRCQTEPKLSYFRGGEDGRQENVRKVEASEKYKHGRWSRLVRLQGRSSPFYTSWIMVQQRVVRCREKPFFFAFYYTFDVDFFFSAAMFTCSKQLPEFVTTKLSLWLQPLSPQRMSIWLFQVGPASYATAW